MGQVNETEGIGTPSKSTTPKLAYYHRPLLSDAILPDGR